MKYKNDKYAIASCLHAIIRDAAIKKPILSPTLIVSNIDVVLY